MDSTRAEMRALGTDRSARYLIAGGWLLIAVLGGSLAFEASRVVLLRQYASGTYGYDLLFSSAPWAVPGSALLGLVFGLLRRRSDAPTVLGRRIRSHDAASFFEHWTVTGATLLLIVTGVLLGNVINGRVFQDVGAVALSMDLHFVGVLVLAFAVFHHLTYYAIGEDRADLLLRSGDIGKAMGHVASVIGRARAPREAKYMASAKLAYLAWAVLIAGVTITGTVKVAAHVWLGMAPGLMQVTTWLHDVFGLGIVLMLVLHLVVVLMPASWPLLGSMFTGYVSRDYAKEHHRDWYDELEKEGSLT